MAYSEEKDLIQNVKDLESQIEEMLSKIVEVEPSINEMLEYFQSFKSTTLESSLGTLMSLPSDQLSLPLPLPITSTAATLIRNPIFSSWSFCNSFLIGILASISTL